jgi:hypothetical protein
MSKYTTQTAAQASHAQRIKLVSSVQIGLKQSTPAISQPHYVTRIQLHQN